MNILGKLKMMKNVMKVMKIFFFLSLGRENNNSM
jgi:hypothetical protein